MDDKRKFHRVPFQCECLIGCGDQSWTGVLRDISLRGALFQLSPKSSLKLGTICYVDIALSDGDVLLQFESELVHRKGDDYGFLFLSENLDTLTHLRRLLELNLGGDDITRHEIEAWLEG